LLLSYLFLNILDVNLCLTKYHAKKKYEGVEVQLHAFLISALDGGEYSASHPVPG